MSSATARDALGRKLFDNLQNDLKSLSAEAKKKHPPVKEVGYDYKSTNYSLI